MKLIAFLDMARIHFQDKLDVGSLDATWPARRPALLAERLQELLDHPE
jgi:hypothetical protein